MSKTEIGGVPSDERPVTKTISCAKCNAAACGELIVLANSGWLEITPSDGEKKFLCPVCSGGAV